jgi:hypothetical protein
VSALFEVSAKLGMASVYTFQFSAELNFNCGFIALALFCILTYTNIKNMKHLSVSLTKFYLCNSSILKVMVKSSKAGKKEEKLAVSLKSMIKYALNIRFYLAGVEDYILAAW